MFGRKVRTVKLYMRVFGCILAASLIGWAIIFVFEPNDPPVTPVYRVLGAVAGLLILPTAPLAGLIEHLENSHHFMPWSGLLMVMSFFISAAFWSFVVFLLRHLWRKTHTEPGAPPNGGPGMPLANSGGAVAVAAAVGPPMGAVTLLALPHRPAQLATRRTVSRLSLSRV